MSRAATLIGSLFPPGWKAKLELLECASRADLQHGDATLGIVLFAFTEHRASGTLPQDGNVREILLGLGELLGGVRAENRHRPQEAVG